MLGAHGLMAYSTTWWRDWVSRRSGFRWRVLALVCLLAAAVAHARSDVTVEELKARVSSAPVAEKAKLCVEIAEKELAATDKLYAADDLDKAQAALTDVIAYAELARDYSIQSHKYQKQAEIAMRSMARKLTDLLHVLSQDEQAPVKQAINQLDRIRDDLLAAMFPKGAK